MNGPVINKPGSSLFSQSNISPSAVKIFLSARRRDLAAAGLILLYCLVFAGLRLSVSSTMELDESEQFLNGSYFALGYTHQPPLYSWMVHVMSLLFGMNIRTLIITKYAIMFFFYLSFYLIARSFWNTRVSLLVAGSLLLFPTYAYEFNRDLSHSVLVAAMASITCYLFVRLLRKENSVDYLLLGVSAGLGFLSKYNFAFFLSAMLLAIASFNEGRRVLSDKRIFLSLAACLAAVLPHVLWLIQNDFISFRHALTKANAGALPLSALQKVLQVVISSYSGVVAFFAVFAILFAFRPRPSLQSRHPHLLFFRYLAFFGLTLPLFVIVVLQTGHFSERWLAPILFSIPLAMFSGIDLESNGARVRFLGYLCIFVAVSILLVRAAIGFFPDNAGKIERIHTPFREVSAQLRRELEQRGAGDLRDLTVVTESKFLAANVTSSLPGVHVLLFDGGSNGAADTVKTPKKLLLWDAREGGGNIPVNFIREYPSLLPMTFSAPYLHSRKSRQYALGAALIQ